MLQPWQRVMDETLVHYKVFKVLRSRRVSPRTGAEHGFFLVDTWDWVNIVAITRDHELILVRQYRQGTDEATLEIPGGILHGKDEDPADAAGRELREETGYAAKEFRNIGATRPNPAIFTNTITTFLAVDCELQGDLIQDPGEDIEVVLLPMKDVGDKIRSGEIDHSLVVAAWGLYLLALDAPDGGL